MNTAQRNGRTNASARPTPAPRSTRRPAAANLPVAVLRALRQEAAAAVRAPAGPTLRSLPDSLRVQRVATQLGLTRPGWVLTALSALSNGPAFIQIGEWAVSMPGAGKQVVPVEVFSTHYIAASDHPVQWTAIYSPGGLSAPVETPCVSGAPRSGEGLSVPDK
uniref:Uncharacterized protein n=1 Tax=Coleopteran tombus-related virus TaxID=2822551 RepID=A0A8A6RT36_9TOMB|nr:hypothetical protein [Coleopteran tombus-related virus]